MKTLIDSVYTKLVLQRPKLALLVLAGVTALFVMYLPSFRLDASADSLLLEGDPALQYYREVRKTYGSQDLLVVVFRPERDIFHEDTLAQIEALSDSLAKVDGIKESFSLLDVPVFRSPKVSLFSLAKGLKTLRDPDVSRELARTELLASPIASQYLVGGQGKATSILLVLDEDVALTALSEERNQLRAKSWDQTLSAAESQRLATVEQQYLEVKQREGAAQKATVGAIRSILDEYRSQGELYLGGVPMIVADMIQFVEHDLFIFGIGMDLFLILALWLIFRRWRWVFLPLVSCLLGGFTMMGLTGLLGWPVTVISSNFLSLQIIIAMSMAIHVIVRYRQLNLEGAFEDHLALVRETVTQVMLPCFYCALTTMVGFGSLAFSGIRPVIDFGWMMTCGIAIAFIITFWFLPAAMLLFRREEPVMPAAKSFSLSPYFARITLNQGRWVLIVAVVLGFISLFGISRLSVENRFIDYFKSHTEISQGMQVIDRDLGGTTPLEIILDGDEKDAWFKKEGRDQLARIHQFVEGLSETGKVLSFHTLVRQVEIINDGKEVNQVFLSLIRRVFPDDWKDRIIAPFASNSFQQARILVMVRESDPNLCREKLLNTIRDYILVEEGIPTEKVHFTGMYVMYNNMLQSLFQSQIQTMGVVFLAVLFMFWILFRSLRLALIGIIPNLFPALLVLGCLGLMGIPLDMMTITIAAISVGIAVDHTIHYIHRFKVVFAETGDWQETVERCHRSIGKAMAYTSIVIIAGFSILMFSNFVPTLYFGFFAGLAMLVALLAALTLLPKLLLLFQPLKWRSESTVLVDSAEASS